MSKTLIVAKILNWFLLLILLTAVAGFISFLNIYGAFLALVTTSVAWGVFNNNRWSYFAAAAWGIACYQLAKQGYEFQTIKHYVMMLGFIVIPIALFLHEILGKPAHKRVTKTADDHEMPQ